MKGACDEEASVEKALWTDKRDQKHEVWGREKEARLVEGRAVRGTRIVTWEMERNKRTE